MRSEVTLPFSLLVFTSGFYSWSFFLLQVPLADNKETMEAYKAWEAQQGKVRHILIPHVHSQMYVTGFQETKKAYNAWEVQEGKVRHVLRSLIHSQMCVTDFKEAMEAYKAPNHSRAR